jgi:hypothetical protein
MKMKVTLLNVEIRSELVNAGRHWEDGSQLVDEVCYLIVTAEDGQRWAHNKVFRGENSRVEVAVLFDRVVDRGAIDLAHWDEVDPVYGSEQYVKQGIEESRWAAERAAERACA